MYVSTCFYCIALTTAAAAAKLKKKESAGQGAGGGNGERLGRRQDKELLRYQNLHPRITLHQNSTHNDTLYCSAACSAVQPTHGVQHVCLHGACQQIEYATYNVACAQHTSWTSHSVPTAIGRSQKQTGTVLAAPQYADQCARTPKPDAGSLIDQVLPRLEANMITQLA